MRRTLGTNATQESESTHTGVSLEDVKHRIAEAGETLLRLPHSQMRQLKRMYGSKTPAFMPIFTALSDLEIELDGKEPRRPRKFDLDGEPGPLALEAGVETLGQAVDRLEEFLSWLWLLDGRQRRLVLLPAMGVRIKWFAARFNCDRRTIQRWRNTALEKIRKIVENSLQHLSH